MIYYWADDFGLFETQSGRIAECLRDGALTGVSILPNSPDLKKCIRLLDESGKTYKLSLHLNLAEGKALSDPVDIPDLVQEDGVFRVSFGALCLWSVSPWSYRRHLKEIETELRAQIRAGAPFLRNGELALDSHCHYHMTPIFMNAMLRAVKAEGMTLSRLRIPREDLKMFLAIRRELHGFRPINLVKVLTLNTLALWARLRHPRAFRNVITPRFSGVMFSGHMDRGNAGAIISYLKKQGGTEICEILFHPGGIYEPEDIRKLTNPNDIHFLTSGWRKAEAEALKVL